jgi:low affinity Fe/Cu permease
MARSNGRSRKPNAHAAKSGQNAGHADAGGGDHTAHQISWFTWFAQGTAHFTGRPITFIGAVAVVVVWGITGPIFHFSDTWQLVINTGTTIVTFLMVFLIQNTQNRDTMALQVKLAELIIAMHGAHNKVAAAEDMCDEDLEALHKAYHLRADETLHTLHKRRHKS